jgi:hypothetical protein
VATNRSTPIDRVAIAEREECFRCGDPIDVDDESVRLMLTRVDPYSPGRQRPLDEEEWQEVRELRARGGMAALAGFVRLGAMCPDCFTVAVAVSEFPPDAEEER